MSVGHFIHLLLGTIALRPYVFLFFMAYLFGCSMQFGYKRALLFSVAGYLIAWGSEVSSIHNGFPYGAYFYIQNTTGRELLVKGVPLMDSASYVFLAYASYSTALFAVSPRLPGREALRSPFKKLPFWSGAFLLDTWETRALVSTRVLAALLFVCLDIIIDPVALRGGRWFLGQIYGYRSVGAYFGVPLSNFIGWAVVGYLMVWAFQGIDLLLERSFPVFGRDRYGRGLSWRFAVGPALYVSVVLFNTAVTFYIGENNIGLADAFIMVPLASVFLLVTRLQIKSADEAAINRHLRDFPGSFRRQGGEAQKTLSQGQNKSFKG